MHSHLGVIPPNFCDASKKIKTPGIRACYYSISKISYNPFSFITKRIKKTQKHENSAVDVYNRGLEQTNFRPFITEFSRHNTLN